jgi:hypothetical protein
VPPLDLNSGMGRTGQARLATAANFNAVRGKDIGISPEAVFGPTNFFEKATDCMHFL